MNQYITWAAKLNPVELRAGVLDKIRNDEALQIRLLRRLRAAMPDARVKWSGYDEYDLVIEPDDRALLNAERPADKLNQLLNAVQDDFVLDALPGNYAMEVLVACRYPVSEGVATLLYDHLKAKKRERFQVFHVSVATPQEVYGGQVLSVLVTSHHIEKDAAPALLADVKAALSLKIDL